MDKAEQIGQAAADSMATSSEIDATAAGRDAPAIESARADGVFSSQSLRAAIEAGWIDSPLNLRQAGRIQPASLDLRLGNCAWRLQCSFLPDEGSTVESKLDQVAFAKMDLHNGALLERNRPYLIPLAENLELPDDVRGRTNPKSSTGRLDVFTRVITDRSGRFDEIRAGYSGSLYLEVVPRSFAVYVEAGLSLNQLRLIRGRPELDDDDLRAGAGAESGLLYVDGEPLAREQLPLADGLFLSLDLERRQERPIGFRAKRTSRPIDLSKIGHYDWREYWEPVRPERHGQIVLEPEEFYLLLSAEGVCIPPQLAAEMAAYDPTAGELRTHYAGFFDPGFGHDPDGDDHGSKAALEVRARDVPFMVEHGQRVCKLAYERVDLLPDLLYGAGLGSHYQRQETMLSKHFTDQTADGQRRQQPAGSAPALDRA